MLAVRAVVAAACLSLGLAGCGGSSSPDAGAQQPDLGAATPAAGAASQTAPTPPTTPAKAGGAGASLPAPKRLTAAQARKLAAAGVLRKADMVGYTAAKTPPDSAQDKALERKGSACLGVKDSAYLARNWGFAYSKAPWEVDSSADVAASAAAARAEMAAWHTTKATSCIKTLIRAELDKQLTGSGAAISAFLVEPVTATVAGADSLFAFRMAITLSGPGGSITMTGYDLGVLVGQTEISLFSFETGSAGHTLAELAALAEKVTARVKALT